MWTGAFATLPEKRAVKHESHLAPSYITVCDSSCRRRTAHCSYVLKCLLPGGIIPGAGNGSGKGACKFFSCGGITPGRALKNAHTAPNSTTCNSPKRTGPDSWGRGGATIPPLAISHTSCVDCAIDPLPRSDSICICSTHVVRLDRFDLPAHVPLPLTPTCCFDFCPRSL